MRRLLSIVVTLAWAAWFGGILAMFMAVQSLFHTFADQRAVAGTGASGIFHWFEVYQLALGAAALLSTFLWRLAAGRSGLKVTLLALFALATAGACYSTFQITPQIEALRRQGAQDTPEFKRLHGVSMMVYAGESAVLLVAGLVLPFALARDGADKQGRLDEDDHEESRVFLSDEAPDGRARR